MEAVRLLGSILYSVSFRLYSHYIPMLFRSSMPYFLVYGLPSTVLTTDKSCCWLDVGFFLFEERDDETAPSQHVAVRWMEEILRRLGIPQLL